MDKARHHHHRERSSWRILYRHFIAGLVVLIPLFLTVWILFKMFNFLDERIRQYLIERFALDFPPYGAGFLVTVTAVIFVGMAARNFIGGAIINFFEKMLLRVPVANRIYMALKQIVSAFVGKDKTIFEKVVLIEYPRKGTYCMGFLTYPDQVHFTDHPEIPNLHCIFIPTTPNPTSGFLLLVPKEGVAFLDMTVEDGLKMIISGGVVLPDTVREMPQVVPGSTNPPPANGGSGFESLAE